jgi:hypothetical protein
MKANAPDKIYIHPDIGGREFLRPWLRIAANNECVQYTQTDSFIERACEFIKDNGSRYIDIVNGQLVLKKGIIKDFKKYMKGEINGV